MRTIPKKIDVKIKQKINSEDYVVRETLAEYLGQAKNIKEAPKLLTYLLRDKESLVRSAAIKSLRGIAAKKYFSKVLPLLNDIDEVVRVDAVECIMYLGGRDAIKYLIKCLNDRSELVRMYVGSLIGRTGDKALAQYVEQRFKYERSSLAKVGLLEGLYLLGQKERLLELFHLFKKRRYIVRCAVANTLSSLVNKTNKKVIKKFLLNVLYDETTIAARSSIKNALRHIR